MPGDVYEKKNDPLLESIRCRADLAMRHLADGHTKATAYILGTIIADTGTDVSWQQESDTGTDNPE